MRLGRTTIRVRARVVLGAASAVLVLMGSTAAFAALLDRAVARWVSGVERALAVVAEIAPDPQPARPAGDRVLDAPAPRFMRHAGARAPAPLLEPDERLDAIRAAFCPEVARRLCGAREHCGCVYAEPDCLDRVEAECSNRLFASFEDHADRIELAPAVLHRCLDVLAALPTHCQLASAMVYGCAWPVRDVATRGEACVVATSRCRDGACASSGCAPLPRTGEPALETMCSWSDVNVDGVCQPAVSVGGACESYRQCTDGIGDCIDGRCAARIAHGGPCTYPWDCDVGLVCSARRCRPAPTWCTTTDTDCGSDYACVLPPSRCRACHADEDCSGTIRCNDGHRCDPGFECVDPEDLGRCQATVCWTAALEGVFRDLE